MINHSLQFYKNGLADMERMLANPDLEDGLRKWCEGSRAFCRKKIRILEYKQWQRGVIAQN